MYDLSLQVLSNHLLRRTSPRKCSHGSSNECLCVEPSTNVNTNLYFMHANQNGGRGQNIVSRDVSHISCISGIIHEQTTLPFVSYLPHRFTHPINLITYMPYYIVCDRWRPKNYFFGNVERQTLMLYVPLTPMISLKCIYGVA